jgi:hypothetical protein
MYKACVTWRDNVKELRRLWSVVFRANRRMKNSVICKAWGCWTENIDQLRLQKSQLAVVEQVAKRMMHQTAYVVLASWAENVEELRCQRSVVFRVGQRMKNSAICKA